jgi:hypothetical protein
MNDQEHLTVVEVKIRVNINSDRPLTEEEVHEMLAEASYEIGENFQGEDSYVWEDEGTAYVCGTEWTDVEVKRLNASF